jgi:plastocyanin domain-containing protein
MIRKTALIGSIASVGILLGVPVDRAIAQMQHKGMQSTTPEQPGQFQRIEQPLWVKAAVTAGGLGLIGLELWWFLLSKPKSRKATAQGGIQEVTVTVDGGYDPSQIVVQAGQPVRLNFYRKDPSSCLEEVRFPDFRIAQELMLNQTTPIEFTPDEPGRYEFTCGMNMFWGVVEVQATGEQSVLQSNHNAGHATHHSDYYSSNS